MENIKFKIGEKVFYCQKLVDGFCICFGKIREIKIDSYGVVYMVNNYLFKAEKLYSYENLTKEELEKLEKLEKEYK